MHILYAIGESNMDASLMNEYGIETILSIKDIKNIVYDTYDYTNGKINPLIICAELSYSTEGYITRYNASMYLNTITIYLDTIVRYIQFAFANNLPRQRGFIAEVVIHELSHLNQYKAKNTYSFNRHSIQYRNYKDIELGNKYNTLLFIREHKNDLIKALKVPVIFDQSYQHLSYEELKSNVNKYYIPMSKEKAFDELDMICKESLRVPLETYVDRKTMDLNDAYDLIRMAIAKSGGVS